MRDPDDPIGGKDIVLERAVGGAMLEPAMDPISQDGGRVGMRWIASATLSVLAAVLAAIMLYGATAYWQLWSSGWPRRWTSAPDYARCMEAVLPEKLAMASYLARRSLGHSGSMGNLRWHFVTTRDALFIHWTLSERQLANAFLADIPTPYGLGLDKAARAILGTNLCQVSPAEKAALMRMVRRGHWATVSAHPAFGSAPFPL